MQKVAHNKFAGLTWHVAVWAVIALTRAVAFTGYACNMQIRKKLTTFLLIAPFLFHNRCTTPTALMNTSIQEKEKKEWKYPLIPQQLNQHSSSHNPHLVLNFIRQCQLCRCHMVNIVKVTVSALCKNQLVTYLAHFCPLLKKNSPSIVSHFKSNKKERSKLPTTVQPRNIMPPVSKSKSGTMKCVSISIIIHANPIFPDTTTYFVYSFVRIGAAAPQQMRSHQSHYTFWLWQLR